MNLLHSIKAKATDSSVNVIIEIPAGSKSKIEYSQEKEKFVVDRIINIELPYPFNYGFIPETWGNDNDPLDALVISSQNLASGQQIETRLIGMLSTTDQEGQDSKIITVPVSETDPSFSKITSTENIGKNLQEKIEYFYKHYKLSDPKKWVDIDGFFSKQDANITLTDAIQRYHHNFHK